LSARSAFVAVDASAQLTICHVRVHPSPLGSQTRPQKRAQTTDDTAAVQKAAKSAFTHRHFFH
jgi:hypothetical protein